MNNTKFFRYISLKALYISNTIVPNIQHNPPFVSIPIKMYIFLYCLPVCFAFRRLLAVNFLLFHIAICEYLAIIVKVNLATFVWSRQKQPYPL